MKLLDYLEQVIQHHVAFYGVSDPRTIEALDIYNDYMDSWGDDAKGVKE